jgi:hypothetical protein
MVHVTMREKTKKQKIELDRKIFEKECTARELRKKLGIRNEISHELPKVYIRLIYRLIVYIL